MARGRNRLGARSGPGSYTGRVTAPSLVVAPSILAADFAHLADEARAVEGAADWLHIDVMDNHFVPNLTIGLPVVQCLRKATTLPLVHIEAVDDPVALARDLRAAGSRAGLAIDRDTPVEPYLELLPHFDTLLIMTIKAGFGGQEFMPELLAKVRTARTHASAGHLQLRIEVDGGIDADSIEASAEAGADAFVAGTAVYRSEDPAEVVRQLRRQAERTAAEGIAAEPTEGIAAGGAARDEAAPGEPATDQAAP